MSRKLVVLSMIILSGLTGLTGSLAQAETDVRPVQMTLSQFLAKVRGQNLDLKIESSKVKAADAKAIGLSIPSPMAELMRTRDSGGVANGYVISQTIPFPTKLWGDQGARKSEARAQSEIKEIRENEILAQARFLYFSLWESQEKLSILEEKKKILLSHIKLSRSSARSDSFAGIHVLKAESDLDFLENETSSEEQSLKQKQAEISAYINEDILITQVVAVEPPLSEIPKINSVEETPQFKSIRFALDSFKSRELEADSSWLPDFTLRYKNMGPSNMAVGYSEVGIGFTVPFLFFWEPYSISRQAGAQRLQSEYELEKQSRLIHAEQESLRNGLNSLKKQLTLLKEKLIPRAEKRMHLVHNLAPRDMETLQDHRETMESFPDLKMKALELRRQYEQTLAALEKYQPRREIR
ncbi:MAG: TolC family protein [Bdellovibrionota bacterium]